MDSIPARGRHTTPHLPASAASAPCYPVLRCPELTFNIGPKMTKQWQHSPPARQRRSPRKCQVEETISSPFPLRYSAAASLLLPSPEGQSYAAHANSYPQPSFPSASGIAGPSIFLMSDRQRHADRQRNE